MSYNDYKDFLQDKLGSSFEIRDDISYDFDVDASLILLKKNSERIYKGSKTSMLTLETYTKDVPASKLILDRFVESYNDSYFVATDGVVYKMYYGGVVVINTFNQVQSNYSFILQISCTLVSSFNMNDIISVTIGTKTQETMTRNINYTAIMDNQRASGSAVHNTSKKRNSVLGFQMTIINSNNDFCHNLSQIRTGAISGNTAFTIGLTFIDGTVETYSMIVESQAFISENGSLPLLHISMKV